MKDINEIDFFGKSSRSTVERRQKLKERDQKAKQGEIYSKKEFDYHYFDNPQNPTGYGGYSYDGRFKNVAKNMITHYQLSTGSKVFELGCAKGFLLVEFLNQGCQIYGQDVSSYAIENCIDACRGRIINQKAPNIPWKSSFFDLVIVKDTLPLMSLDTIEETIKELIRVSKGHLFFDIECGRTDSEKKLLKEWDEAQHICEDPIWWKNLLNQCGYKGDCNFKVLIED